MVRSTLLRVVVSLSWCRGPAAPGELPAEVEVLAVGLLQRLPQGLNFLAVLFLQVRDLSGQCEDEGAFRTGGGGRCEDRAGLGSQALDASTQVGVVVEEGMGDTCLALDGLEGLSILLCA